MKVSKQNFYLKLFLKIKLFLLDFFQDLKGQTPTQWLSDLLKGYKRDASDGERIVLDSIFSSIECHTLFLPHSEKQKLRHLDRVEAAEFSEDYKKDIAELRTKVYTQTLKSKRVFNGASLARLLELLVEYANAEGAYPEISSIWASFSKLQIQEGLTAATQLYISGIQFFRFFFS